MNTIYILMFFIMGLIFGSFFNVVGSRMPEKQSIVYPPSHCDNCKHRLTPIELIPVISYIIQGGKCRSCKKHISIFHPLYELFCGIIYVLCYLKFGFTVDIIIPITFISMLLINIVSDIFYMIIIDEVLIFFGVCLLIEIGIIKGIDVLGVSILNGLASFILMLLIKLIGDKAFKRESMGGGDIKLMFFFGLCTGFLNSILSIFMAAFLGFPYAILSVKKNNTHELPFGPFLSLAIIIIILTGFGMNELFNVLVSI